ncbi:MAG: hypothetical protein V1885_00735 [Candidatus Brennerbacteria bacterium]
MNGINTTNGAPENVVAEQFAQERLPVGWPWRLLVFSIALFAFSILVYFGIRVGYSAYLEDRIVEVDAALTALTSEVTSADQEQFVGFYSQIVNLKSVLEWHEYGANIFTFLEKYTLPEIQFTEGELNAEEFTLSLRGSGVSVNIVGQQLAALETAPGVAKVLLRDVNTEGRATFSFTIVFTEAFFDRPLL